MMCTLHKGKPTYFYVRHGVKLILVRQSSMVACPWKLQFIVFIITVISFNFFFISCYIFKVAICNILYMSYVGLVW